MKESGIHVLLAPEQVGDLWGIPLTSTLLTSWVVIALLVTVAFLVGRRLQLTPGKFQTFLEMLVSFVYDYITETLESRVWARRMFPLLMTIFLFIAVSNLLEFTPGIGSIGIFHGD